MCERVSCSRSIRGVLVLSGCVFLLCACEEVSASLCIYVRGIGRGRRLELMAAHLKVWMVRWVRLRVTEPLLLVIRRGAEPKTLAISGAMGVTLGVFPVYGVTALLCACAIGALGGRCNAPTMLIANLIATPLELSLVIPFLRLGEWLVGGKRLMLSKDALWEAVSGRASYDVILGIWHALLGWSIAAPVIVACLYFILLPVMALSVQKLAIVPVASPLTPLIKDAIV